MRHSSFASAGRIWIKAKVQQIFLFMFLCINLLSAFVGRGGKWWPWSAPVLQRYSKIEKKKNHFVRLNVTRHHFATNNHFNHLSFSFFSFFINRFFLLFIKFEIFLFIDPILKSTSAVQLGTLNGNFVHIIFSSFLFFKLSARNILPLTVSFHANR